MFVGCDKIIELEMNNFSAHNLSNVSDMFGYNRLTNIKSISINNWNIPSVTNLYRMFFDKSKLTVLNMEGFNAPSATDISYMFSKCVLLESIDLKDFDLGNVTNMFGMFELDSSLKILNISGINSEIYEKDIFKTMIGQVGNITFYVKDSECKTLLEAIKPNATVKIKSV